MQQSTLQLQHTPTHTSEVGLGGSVALVLAVGFSVHVTELGGARHTSELRVISMIISPTRHHWNVILILILILIIVLNISRGIMCFCFSGSMATKEIARRMRKMDASEMK